MERLTSRNPLTERGAMNLSLTDLYMRLKAYEDMEEEGRLLVLPCKVGDTVYRITHDYCDLRGLDKCDSYCDGWDQSCDMNGGGLFVEKGQFTFADLDEIGKTVFLTREAAEAKLKECGE